MKTVHLCPFLLSYTSQVSVVHFPLKCSLLKWLSIWVNVLSYLPKHLLTIFIYTVESSLLFSARTHARTDVASCASGGRASTRPLYSFHQPDRPHYLINGTFVIDPTNPLNPQCVRATHYLHTTQRPPASTTSSSRGSMQHCEGRGGGGGRGEEVRSSFADGIIIFGSLSAT